MGNEANCKKFCDHQEEEKPEMSEIKINEYPLDCLICHQQVEHTSKNHLRSRQTSNCTLISITSPVSNKKTNTSLSFAFYATTVHKICKIITPTSTLSTRTSITTYQPPETQPHPTPQHYTIQAKNRKPHIIQTSASNNF